MPNIKFQIPNLERIGSEGIAALSTVLMILAVVVVLIISTTYSSIGEAQSGFALFQGEENLGQVEGCVEDAILKARSDPAFGEPLNEQVNINRPSPQPACVVTVISKTGTDPITWDMDVTLNTTTHKRTINVDFIRGDTGIALNNWNEI